MQRGYSFKKLSELIPNDIFTFELKTSRTKYWVFVTREERIAIAKSGKLIKKFLDDEIVIKIENS